MTQLELDFQEEERALLVAALRRAVKIVSFTIANLGDGSVKGWPVDDIKALGELLRAPSIPLAADEKEIGVAFEQFARPPEYGSTMSSTALVSTTPPQVPKRGFFSRLFGLDRSEK